jgi:lambda family phage portal protein
MAEPTVLDRVIGWLSPTAGVRRAVDRLRLARAYEAAAPRDPWRPRRPGASANADHAADASALRSKARALMQNVPYIRAGMSARLACIVGTGIVPTFKGTNGPALQKLWNQWVRVADADQRLDIYGLQAAAVRAMEVDGECLIRIRARYKGDGLPVPMQLQLLEVDWLDNTRARGAGENQVVNGIEYDSLGRPVAYWLWDQHPGDTTLKRGTRTQSSRVAAEQVLHLFAPERPGQGRGFPRLAPVITRVRDLQLYEDGELSRKNLESRLSVLVSGDAASLANPITGGGVADPSKARETGSLGELASGSITELPPGVNVSVVAPTVAEGYVDYIQHQLHIICAGAGFTYEAATGDMTKVNYSSARVRMLDVRREVEQLQWTVIVPVLCQRIVDEFVLAAERAGLLSGSSYTVEHSTPRWEYVDPQKDVEADMREISGGLASISEKLRRRGYDPMLVFDELQSDIEELRKRGLLDVLLAMQGKKIAEPAPDGGGAVNGG